MEVDGEAAIAGRSASRVAAAKRVWHSTDAASRGGRRQRTRQLVATRPTELAEEPAISARAVFDPVSPSSVFTEEDRLTFTGIQLVLFMAV